MVTHTDDNTEYPTALLQANKMHQLLALHLKIMNKMFSFNSN